MNLNVFTILVGTAAVLAVVALIRPAWSLTTIGLFLVCLALLVK